MGLHVLFTTEKLIVNYSQGYDILVFMNIDFVVVFIIFFLYTGLYCIHMFEYWFII